MGLSHAPVAHQDHWSFYHYIACGVQLHNSLFIPILRFSHHFMHIHVSSSSIPAHHAPPTGRNNTPIAGLVFPTPERWPYITPNIPLPSRIRSRSIPHHIVMFQHQVPGLLDVMVTVRYIPLYFKHLDTCHPLPLIPSPTWHQHTFNLPCQHCSLSYSLPHVLPPRLSSLFLDCRYEPDLCI